MNHMNLFQLAISKQNKKRPPVWMMRQAGRYHSHYQKLRKKYSFIELCKKPEIACEATLGPIQDFNFDAAILFSDLLFPLEAMGMGLSYQEGPKLSWHLEELKDLRQFEGGANQASQLEFQSEALRLIRARLNPEKGLLGFVGGPLTLFCYAVEGSHQGNLASSRKGIFDGRFDGFVEKLFDLLVENMVMQAQSGADAIAVLDTCAGEFDAMIYQEKIVPVISKLFNKFAERMPKTHLVYYSKGTNQEHWKLLRGLPFSCLGIDWKHDLGEVIKDFGSDWAIQGNIDPNWLLLDSVELEKRLSRVFQTIQEIPIEKREGWICGLGHGILPGTPEQNVRLFLKLQREFFSERSL